MVDHGEEPIVKHRFKNGTFVKTNQAYLHLEFLIIKNVHHYNKYTGVSAPGYVYNVTTRDGQFATPIHSRWLDLDET